MWLVWQTILRVCFLDFGWIVGCLVSWVWVVGVGRFLGGVLGDGFVACDRGCLFEFDCDCLAEVFCLVWG